MKIRFILPFTLLLFFSTLAYSQYAVGVGLVGGTSTGFDFENGNERIAPGAQLKFQYRLNDMFAVAPNIAYFLPSELLGLKYNYFEANLDFQINVLDNDYNRGYFLLGPTFNLQSVSLPDVVEGADGILEGDFNRFGGFIGFGVEQSSNFYQEFVVQYKTKEEGTLYKEIQVMVKVGYLYNWGKPKETFRKGFEVMTEENPENTSN